MPDFSQKSLQIETKRLELHPFREEDLEDGLALFCNEEIRRTYILPELSSREDGIKLFRILLEQSRSQSHFVYGAYLENRLIGFLNDVEADSGAAEVGYVIHPEHKGHGYATELLQACIQELFRLGFQTVTAGCFSENAASRRVMEKAGMKPTGRTEEIPYGGTVHTCNYFEIRQ